MARKTPKSDDQRANTWYLQCQREAAVICRDAPPLIGVDGGMGEPFAERMERKGLENRFEFASFMLAFYRVSTETVRYFVHCQGEFGPDRMQAAWWYYLSILDLPHTHLGRGSDGPTQECSQEVGQALDRSVQALLDSKILRPDAYGVLVGKRDEHAAARMDERKQIIEFQASLKRMAEEE